MAKSRTLELLLTLIAFCGLLTTAQADAATLKHEKGRCAIRGECGKEGFFGKPLPCPDNGLAKEPSEETRKKLIKICGDKWSEGATCCDDEQVGLGTFTSAGTWADGS